MGVHMKYKGYILLGITILIFSTLEVVTSTLKGVINPLQLTFIRFFIGGFVLLPFALWKKEKLQIKDWLFFLGLGVLNIFVSMGALQLSISTGKASTAAILISSNPIFVMVFSSIILKEKATLDKLICIAFGIAGISLIIFKGSNGGDTAVSLLLAMLASLTFGLYTVLGKLKSQGVSSITMISLSSILGSLFYIPVLLYNGIPIFYIPQEAILEVLYLGIFLSGIAYITYMEALRVLTASKGAMVFFLKPVIASTLAVFFLKEELSIKTIIGMLLVLIGILINFVKLNARAKDIVEVSSSN
jgi:drug/metabolite transporter (DMT)-like permease